MLKKYTGKLYCFSPPVMLATFLIEFGLALYVIWRYKLNTVSRLVTATLICLGVFQLAEYMVCGGLGLSTSEWSRLGYVSITLLPALGIHLVTAIAGRKSTPLLIAAYGSTALFAAYFAFAPGAINIHECRPNYAVFNMEYTAVQLYTLQYYGWLFAGIFFAWHLAKQVPKRARALYGMMAGYTVFLVPTTAINLLDPTTVAGIPSIMCGFAILLAVILVTVVMPHVGHVKRSVSATSQKARHS